MIDDIKKRIELKIPPYDPEDLKKDHCSEDYFGIYGDYIVWLEFIETIKKSHNDDVYFIENEKKLAFWENRNYTKFWPFLTNEVKEKCDVKSFNAFRFENLINLLQSEFDATVIQEVESIKGEFDKLYKDTDYIQKYVDTFYIPSFEDEEDDIISQSIGCGLVDYVGEIEYEKDTIDFKNMKIKIDYPESGQIQVNVPVQYECSCSVNVYYGTGDDYYPYTYNGKILTIYNASIIYNYYYDDSIKKLIKNPKDYTLEYDKVYIDYDSFSSSELEDSEYDKCEYCGTPLDDDNRSFDNPSICCDCATSIEKLENE